MWKTRRLHKNGIQDPKKDPKQDKNREPGIKEKGTTAASKAKVGKKAVVRAGRAGHQSGMNGTSGKQTRHMATVRRTPSGTIHSKVIMARKNPISKKRCPGMRIKKYTGRAITPFFISVQQTWGGAMEDDRPLQKTISSPAKNLAGYRSPVGYSVFGPPGLFMTASDRGGGEHPPGRGLHFTPGLVCGGCKDEYSTNEIFYMPNFTCYYPPNRSCGRGRARPGIPVKISTRPKSSSLLAIGKHDLQWGNVEPHNRMLKTFFHLSSPKVEVVKANMEETPPLNGPNGSPLLSGGDIESNPGPHHRGFRGEKRCTFPLAKGSKRQPRLDKWLTRWNDHPPVLTSTNPPELPEMTRDRAGEGTPEPQGEAQSTMSAPLEGQSPNPLGPQNPTPDPGWRTVGHGEEIHPPLPQTKGPTQVELSDNLVPTLMETRDPPGNTSTVCPRPNISLWKVAPPPLCKTVDYKVAPWLIPKALSHLECTTLALDAFASAHNAVCPTYWTEAEDAFAQPWRRWAPIWANPPLTNWREYSTRSLWRAPTWYSSAGGGG